MRMRSIMFLNTTEHPGGEKDHGHKPVETDISISDVCTSDFIFYQI
jgi:hypothetical protein